MNRYIMKLKPVCKDIIWGGTRLKTEYHKESDSDRVAESWELCCHPDGMCEIANGEYAGMKLADYLGGKEFPALIKLIDACDRLSVQVHPAKTEMWVVVDCDEGAQLVYGLKNKFDEKEFRAALDEGKIEDLLNYVPVHKGDVFFIPTGLVHAIGKGILIAEIQQNSNVTYRVYDYGRLQNGKPRQLHVEEAISVIRDFTPEEMDALRYSKEPKTRDSLLASCKYFTADTLKIDGELMLDSSDSWVCLICIGGKGMVGDVEIQKGETVFVPEGYGKFTVSGSLDILSVT